MQRTLLSYPLEPFEIKMQKKHHNVEKDLADMTKLILKETS
jgi:hypothetical protein